MVRILGLLLLVACSVSAASAAPGKLRAAAYAQDITPALPISLNGGLSDRIAKAVHDPLHARCLVLDDGQTKVAIVVCDSCMIPREVFDAAKEIASKKTGIPTAHMMISATHSHTAPTATGVFQSDPDEGYRKLLIEKIAAGIITAHDRLEPAKLAWGAAKDDKQVFNRRWLTKEGIKLPNPFGEEVDRVKMNPGLENPNVGKPAGPIDPEVSVLAVLAAGGEPLALLANYGLHYVGGTPGDQVSADYFAAFADHIQKLVDTFPRLGNPSRFVGIMSNGTSGDINNVNFALRAFPARKPGEQIDLVAQSVAEAAKAAYDKIESLSQRKKDALRDGDVLREFVTASPWSDAVRITMAQAQIELAVRKPTAEDVAKARQVLEKAKAKGPVLATLPEIYARETVLLAEYPDKVKVKLQALRLAGPEGRDLAIVAIPCEVFVEIGLSIKKNSPVKQTFIISLANGYNGYLPTPAQHELGGYETWRARSSYLEVKASELIEAKVMELLEEVKGK